MREIIMAKQPPSDVERREAEEFVLTHLDNQIASTVAMIAAARACGAAVDLLKARETRLRDFASRLRRIH
jgi:hypothetical protein